MSHRLVNTNLRHTGVTGTMRGQVEDHIKTCNKCQGHKIVGKPNYGILSLVPALRDKKTFEKVHLDCVGPWTVRIKDDPLGQIIEYDIHILTMVDACINWTKLSLIPTAS